MGMAVIAPEAAWGVGMTDVGNVRAGTATAATGPPRVRPQVVPLRGLPIVAAVVVFVIASIAARSARHAIFDT